VELQYSARDRFPKNKAPVTGFNEGFWAILDKCSQLITDINVGVGQNVVKVFLQSRSVISPRLCANHIR
jgi:hypothetical protein